MKTELIIDGNAVYEIDLECQRKKLEKGDGKSQQTYDVLELMAGQCQPGPDRFFLRGMLIWALYGRLRRQ